MTVTLEALLQLLTERGGWVPEPPPREAFRISLKEAVGKLRIEQFHTNNATDTVVEALVDETGSLCAIDFF